MTKISILFLLFLLLSSSCTSLPRYVDSKNEISTKSQSKKSKSIYYGISSFYGLNDGFDGQLTANGEIYDKDGLSAAHKTLPLNTIVRVTNLENNKSLILRINDRGPYVKGRILDCSYGAAKKLDFPGAKRRKTFLSVLFGFGEISVQNSRVGAGILFQFSTIWVLATKCFSLHSLS